MNGYIHAGYGPGNSYAWVTVCWAPAGGGFPVAPTTPVSTIPTVPAVTPGWLEAGDGPAVVPVPRVYDLSAPRQRSPTAGGPIRRPRSYALRGRSTAEQIQTLERELEAADTRVRELTDQRTEERRRATELLEIERDFVSLAEAQRDVSRTRVQILETELAQARLERDIEVTRRELLAAHVPTRLGGTADRRRELRLARAYLDAVIDHVRSESVLPVGVRRSALSVEMLVSEAERLEEARGLLGRVYGGLFDEE